MASVTSKRPPRILCLDGGGMRGLFTLEVLKKIEHSTGEKVLELQNKYLYVKIVNMFDIITGTSTGGIIALALGLCRLSLDEVKDLYWDLGKTVFQYRFGSYSRYLFGSGNFYGEETLEAWLQRHLGTESLEQYTSDSYPKVRPK
jgi:patatin-like phospholipase/acyl hydrolase